MAEEILSWCKIDAHLDTNPKIRRAGRDGRDVFEFVVRRNSLMRLDGMVPIKYVAAWYLADVLMMSEDEARNGVSRAVTAGLIEVDEGAGMVRIVGWTTEWGRRPLTNTERQEAFRARKESPKSNEHSAQVTPSNAESRPVTDVTDQRRGDQIRGEEIRSENKNSARPPAGGALVLESPRPPRRSRAKSKITDPTPRELELVTETLAALTKRNDVRYSRTDAHTKLIIDRLRDGVAPMDLRKIIAYCAEPTSAGGKGWVDKPEMRQFLCPETLFGPQTISKYLDPARSWFAKEFPDAEEQSA